jgi:hypothetical protein
MKQKMALIAGVLLFLLGTGFLVFLWATWDSLYRMVSLFGGPVETSMTPEAWAYVLGGVMTVVIGTRLVSWAKRRK